MPNIVQAEFFHVGGEKFTSIDAVWRECADRIFEKLVENLNAVQFEFVRNGGIKTVVRFFDKSQRLTPLVQEYRSAQQEHQSLFKDVHDLGWFKRKRLNTKSRRLSRKMDSLRVHIYRATIKELQTAVATSQKIAIEQWDHSFRLAHANELHELLEAVTHTVNMWMFVFKENDLCADKNTLVTRMM